MPYSEICLIAECLIGGMFYKRKKSGDVLQPYTANNAINSSVFFNQFMDSEKRKHGEPETETKHLRETSFGSSI